MSVIHTTMATSGELARMAACVEALVGPDLLHRSVMRQINTFDTLRDLLEDAVLIAGALPGEYRIDCLFRRQPGEATLRPVLR